MYSHRRHRAKSNRRSTKTKRRSFGKATSVNHSLRERAKARRAIAPRNPIGSFDPPEDWYEATGEKGYRVIVREPGNGYRHVVTPEQVKSRLSRLPKGFLTDLEVVQLCTMTRKKEHSPCYGLQWGQAIYLYPFEETLDEYFLAPPPRSLVIETRMYGGRWDLSEPGVWRLVWTESSARDFQLNNVLIHELGHLVDKRNTNYIDQERFAEWFAVEYGYRGTGGMGKRRPNRKVRRRHHK